MTRGIQKIYRSVANARKSKIQKKNRTALKLRNTTPRVEQTIRYYMELFRREMRAVRARRRIARFERVYSGYRTTIRGRPYLYTWRRLRLGEDIEVFPSLNGSHGEYTMSDDVRGGKGKGKKSQQTAVAAATESAGTTTAAAVQAPTTGQKGNKMINNKVINAGTGGASKVVRDPEPRPEDKKSDTEVREKAILEAIESCTTAEEFNNLIDYDVPWPLAYDRKTITTNWDVVKTILTTSRLGIRRSTLSPKEALDYALKASVTDNRNEMEQKRLDNDVLIARLRLEGDLARTAASTQERLEIHKVDLEHRRAMDLERMRNDMVKAEQLAETQRQRAAADREVATMGANAAALTAQQRSADAVQTATATIESAKLDSQARMYTAQRELYNSAAKNVNPVISGAGLLLGKADVNTHEERLELAYQLHELNEGLANGRPKAKFVYTGPQRFIRSERMIDPENPIVFPSHEFPSIPSNCFGLQQVPLGRFNHNGIELIRGLLRDSTIYEGVEYIGNDLDLATRLKICWGDARTPDKFVYVRTSTMSNIINKDTRKGPGDRGWFSAYPLFVFPDFRSDTPDHFRWWGECPLTPVWIYHKAEIKLDTFQKVYGSLRRGLGFKPTRVLGRLPNILPNYLQKTDILLGEGPEHFRDLLDQYGIFNFFGPGFFAEYFREAVEGMTTFVTKCQYTHVRRAYISEPLINYLLLKIDDKGANVSTFHNRYDNVMTCYTAIKYQAMLDVANFFPLEVVDETCVFLAQTMAMRQFMLVQNTALSGQIKTQEVAVAGKIDM